MIIFAVIICLLEVVKSFEILLNREIVQSSLRRIDLPLLEPYYYRSKDKHVLWSKSEVDELNNNWNKLLWEVISAHTEKVVIKSTGQAEELAKRKDEDTIKSNTPSAYSNDISSSTPATRLINNLKFPSILRTGNHNLGTGQQHIPILRQGPDDYEDWEASLESKSNRDNKLKFSENNNKTNKDGQDVVPSKNTKDKKHNDVSDNKTNNKSKNDDEDVISSKESNGSKGFEIFVNKNDNNDDDDVNSSKESNDEKSNEIFINQNDKKSNNDDEDVISSKESNDHKDKKVLLSKNGTKGNKYNKEKISSEKTSDKTDNKVLVSNNINNLEGKNDGEDVIPSEESNDKKAKKVSVNNSKDNDDNEISAEELSNKKINKVPIGKNGNHKHNLKNNNNGNDKGDEVRPNKHFKDKKDEDVSVFVNTYKDNDKIVLSHEELNEQRNYKEPIRKKHKNKHTLRHIKKHKKKHATKKVGRCHIETTTPTIDPTAFASVYPNSIYIREPKCSNWLNDCSLQGIRSRLLQAYRGPF